jgi:pimeloyl-ACP methyl ester carboxylesterase
MRVVPRPVMTGAFLLRLNACLLAGGCGSRHDVTSGCCDGASATEPNSPSGDATAAFGCGLPGLPRNGFPGDFPQIIDGGGFGRGEVIQGFGGELRFNRCAHRVALAHRPVVLLHGNGVTVTDTRFGMTEVRDRLRAAGWADAEIWAPSYLGQTVWSAEVPTPQRNNVGDVRAFIDAVIDYLGVERVDLVGHSLGCNLVNDYLRGLQADGRFDPAARRFDRVGTVVCLGGAVYGTGDGPLFEPEYAVSGAWVATSLVLDGIEDATPYGAADVADMEGPPTGGTLPQGRAFHTVSVLDGGARRIHWVALWAIDDIIDSNLKNAGGLGGADLNRGATRNCSTTVGCSPPSCPT